MAHQPYEDWLLDDERLTPEQDRDLRVHLRTCAECNALARANLSLRSTAVIAPAEGFALRFQARLAAQRKVQRQRSVIGLFLLALAGSGGLLWLLFPYLPYLALPPQQLVGLWISNLVYIGLTVRALSVFGNVILNVLGSQVPMYVWLILLPMLGGSGLLWSIFFRRTGKIAQSAT